MKRQAGFTLLETLVVLVLVALIVGVLADGGSRLGDLRQRLATRVEGASDRAMRIGWFRQSVANALPDLPGGSGLFHGDAQSLTLLTLAPVGAAGGTPTILIWRLSEPAPGLHRLEVQEGDRTLETLTWRGPRGLFAYLDAAGMQHARWPDADGAPQLPAAVLLQSGADETPVVTFAAIAGAKNVPAKLLEAAQR
ncbi:prepilin-type N-terminal cleavage/methylation domain-containing protein [Roseiterribacter gracilis]|uniref:Prepilin-type N-terminal cleavage/methylation domain-containing protein n=1 Tax=Roseiterribacter gracilis TaxID=2812848 RepID=A0A8S8XIF9_9PROT|nr:hypothetical protein TMPK1_40290 [Rhodospirillales bacterium TMPK1]